MIAVHKFQVPLTHSLSIEMPKGAAVLSVAIQGGNKVVWAKVDTSAPIVVRRFQWRGTGHDASAVGVYVGTVQERDGALVWHLFDGGEA